MAEDVKDFEKEIADEEAQLKAETARLAREAQPEPPEEAAAAEPIPPAETPPAETPPAAATPPEPKVEEPRRDGAAWKLLRQKEKELKEARDELAARTARDTPPDPNKEPDFETQPADYLKKRTEHTDAELAAIRQELAARKQQDDYQRYIDGIKADETVFVKDHPDYFKAAEFLVEKETQRWQRVGLAVVHTRNVLNNAHSADPRFGQLRNDIQTLTNDPQVLKAAEEQGRDPEEVAAWVVARNLHVTARRDELATAARAGGKSVAQAAYDEAVDWGWNGNPQDGTAKENEARARVVQAREVANASRSLSDSPSAEAAPEVRVLKNRNQVLDLDEESLDALIKSGNYRQL